MGTRNNTQQRMTSFRKYWQLILVVPILMMIPVVIKALVPTTGFYYTEGFVLSLINVGLAICSRCERKNAASKWIFIYVSLVSALAVLSIGIVILLPKETVFELFANNPLLYGLLGVTFGAVSALVTCIGWQIDPAGSEQKLAKTLVGYLVLFSIVISAMVYTANNPLLISSMLPVYASMSVPLGVLLLLLGFLLPPQERNTRFGLSKYILVSVSFGTGFIYGGLTIPLTRAIYASLGLIRVYPGIFFLMLQFIVTLALIPYALVEDNRIQRVEPHACT